MYGVDLGLQEEEDGLLKAGSRAQPGRYCRVDVPDWPVVVLNHEDWLPASLDGQVALYRRIDDRWQVSCRLN